MDRGTNLAGHLNRWLSHQSSELNVRAGEFDVAFHREVSSPCFRFYANRLWKYLNGIVQMEETELCFTLIVHAIDACANAPSVSLLSTEYLERRKPSISIAV